eukprot:1343172-Amorphochlora_amoeboformis.AAC.1
MAVVMLTLLVRDHKWLDCQLVLLDIVQDERTQGHGLGHAAVLGLGFGHAKVQDIALAHGHLQVYCVIPHRVSRRMSFCGA